MIRPAVYDDLPAMAELEASEAMGSQWRLAQLEEELHRTHAQVLVAVSNDQFLGHAIAWLIAEELEIMTIAVCPQYRRKGIGQALLSHLLNLPHRRSLLELRAQNHSAHAFYTSVDFQAVGLRKAYYRNGDDAVLMERKNGLQ